MSVLFLTLFFFAFLRKECRWEKGKHRKGRGRKEERQEKGKEHRKKIVKINLILPNFSLEGMQMGEKKK